MLPLAFLETSIFLLFFGGTIDDNILKNKTNLNSYINI